MQRAWIVGVLLLLGVAGVACQSTEEQRERHAQRAAAFFEEGKWGEAKVEYLNLLNVDPDNGEANLRLADVHWELREYGDALWRYREAVRLSPDDTKAVEKFATVLFFARRNDEAREQIDRVLEREPDRATALILSARIHGSANDREAVLADLERIVATRADSDDEEARGYAALALAMKSQTLEQADDPEGAEAALRQLVVVQPKAESHLLLGGLLGRLERNDEAIAEFQTAMSQADEELSAVRAAKALASFHASRQDFASAEKVLLKARSDFPANEELLLRLGQLYQSQGKTDQAAGMIEEIAASRPDDATPLIALAEFRRRLGQHDEALAAVDRALERDPKLERARLLRAEYLREDAATDPEKAVEAERILAEVLEENPNSIFGLFTEAKFLLLDGRPQEASNRLRRVVQEQPGSNAHFLLGNAYERMDQPDLARSEYLQALQLDAGNQNARRALASLYLGSGNRQLAIQEAEDALRRSPGDPFLTLIRAEGLLGLGRGKEAVAALDSVDFASAGNERVLQAASLYVRSGGLDQGRALIEGLLEHTPNDAAALRQLVALDAIGGDPKAGVERITAAIEGEPERAELYELRAMLYMGFRNRSGRCWTPKAITRAGSRPTRARSSSIRRTSTPTS